jgi:hypothetical protein
MITLDIDHNNVERQKQFRRQLWEYKPVDHIPVFIWPSWTFGYTQRQATEDSEIQLEVNFKTVEKCLRLIPDDYIPWVRVWPGYMTIATMFGMQPHWSDDPNQPPGVKGHLIHDIEQVYSLKRPGMDAGLMPENIRRFRMHAERLPKDVSLSGLDLGGPLLTCRDLLDTDLLYTAFYDHPDHLHYLLNLATEVQLEIVQTLVQTVGGKERLTSTDFDPIWAPEPYKGFFSDDTAATISPKLFKEFCMPYNNRLLRPWGHGLLHNCGPHPCKGVYLDHDPKLKGLSLAYKYSQADFPALREIFAGWGVIHILMDNELTPEAMLASFRNTMETLGPDVIGVPCCFIDDTWHDDDITQIYWDMRKIGNEYAANMHWRPA